jgi:hypothetical protein
MMKATLTGSTSGVIPQYAPADALHLARFLDNVTFPYPLPLPGVIDPPRPFGG